MKKECDFCNSKNLKKIFDFPEWELVECNFCGLRFGINHHHNCQNSIKNIYNSNYYNSFNAKQIGYSNYIASAMTKKLTFKRHFEIIEKYITPSKYLDVGCAFGFSIEIANNRMWKSEGIDISEYACGIARKLTRNTIYNADFLSINKNKKYDLISAWDVLEHTLSPNRFFSQLKKHINKKGIIALTTPNSGSIVASLCRKNWFEYKWPEHRYFLSNKILKAYCEKYGFKIIKLQFAYKYKTLGDSICRWFGLYENKEIFNSKLFDRLILYSSFGESLLIAQNS